MTVAIAIASLTATLGLTAGGIVESVFVQEMDSETIICDIELPIGSSPDRVRKRVMEISDFANQQPEVVNVQGFVGIQIDVAGEGAVEVGGNIGVDVEETGGEVEAAAAAVAVAVAAVARAAFDRSLTTGS